MAAYWLVRFILWTLAIAPDRVVRGLAQFYVDVLDLGVPKLRRVGMRNVAQIARLHEPERIVDGVFQSIARSLITFSRLPSLNAQNISSVIRYDGLEHFEQAKARGKGVLFATAHMGNWELSAFAHGLMTEPMNVVVRPLDNPRIDEFVESRRQLGGNRIISKKDAARQILRALKNNEAVGILIDQNAALDEGAFIDFFGTPACAGTAFARLAAHTGAAVIPGFALWNDAEDGYVLKFYPIVEMSGDALEDTRRVHAVIEQVIREFPDQWLWLHRRWKTRPPGEKPLY
ncbi:MAG TPA: lysophospholipid acyltransferase family protein [Bryobacteraceae bacterium]